MFNRKIKARMKSLESRICSLEASMTGIGDLIRQETTASTYDFGIVNFRGLARIVEKIAKKVPPEGGK